MTKKLQEKNREKNLYTKQTHIFKKAKTQAPVANLFHPFYQDYQLATHKGIGEKIRNPQNKHNKQKFAIRRFTPNKRRLIKSQQFRIRKCYLRTEKTDMNKFWERNVLYAIQKQLKSPRRFLTTHREQFKLQLRFLLQKPIRSTQQFSLKKLIKQYKNIRYRLPFIVYYKKRLRRKKSIEYYNLFRNQKQNE